MEPSVVTDRADRPRVSLAMPGDESPRLTIQDAGHTGARIKVVGVGGGGSNAVNRMVRSGLDGVEYIVANTDAQALSHCAAPLCLQLGGKLTKGLGAGADPNVGRQAALEDTEQIISALDGADMVFVTTGLGGGTGTGAAPVIANLASELGALTVAVVTKPFAFEGHRRAKQAESGLEELREAVDTVITIPNERLLSMTDRSTTLSDAFELADDVLRQAIQGISELILVPGLINLDFADVTTIMSGKGLAIMGTGVGAGDTKVVDAATQSIIHAAAHEDANIIFGAVVDPSMDGRVKITVIATGFEREGAKPSIERATAKTPVDLQRYSSWQEEPQAQAVSGGTSFGVSRRPLIELPLPEPVEADQAGDMRLDLDGGESEFDVPAFLRQRRAASSWGRGTEFDCSCHIGLARCSAECG
jgi:cell division protein FtsZ